MRGPSGHELEPLDPASKTWLVCESAPNKASENATSYITELEVLRKTSVVPFRGQDERQQVLWLVNERGNVIEYLRWISSLVHWIDGLEVLQRGG